MSLLLCDLDDTLVDRDEAFRIWATRFTELHSLPAPQTVSWLIELDGHGYTSRSELVAAIIERHGIWSDPAIAIREFRDELVSCLPSVSSQVAAELSRLREAGWRVGIVTNGEIKQQENKVKASGLDRLVDAVVVSDAVGCRKPDPAIFQNAAERCSAGLEGGWMIGDNPEADIGGAAAVGLKTIWLRRGRRWDVPGIRPVVQVDSLLDGLSYLARLPQMEAAPEPQVQVTESPPVSDCCRLVQQTSMNWRRCTPIPK